MNGPVPVHITRQPREECGVLGISTPHGEGVAQLTFFGLFALQHRGQEAAGIAVSDGQRARVHKQPGLVSHVFTNDTLKPLSGYHSIGHTRYSTTGSSQRAQHPAVPGRNDVRPAGAGPQRQHRQHAGAARGAAEQGLRAHRDQRLRGDDADAGRRRRQDVGGAHRAHAAGVEGRVLARPAGRRPGPRRARPVGLPAAVGRAPPARRPRRGQRDVRAVDARLRRDLRGPAGRDRHAAGRRAAPPPGARPGPRPGPLHVRVRLLLAARLELERPQRAPLPRAARRRAGRRVGRRRRRRHPGAGLLDPGRHRVLPGQRRAVQRRADQEPLHRAHVHRADAGDPRPRRGAQVQRPVGEPRRQAGRDDRRLARAGHDGRAARQADPRRRRHRGPRAHHLPADHAPLPLRRRHGPRRRPDRGPPDASTRSASGSAPTAWSSCRWRG